MFIQKDDLELYYNYYIKNIANLLDIYKFRFLHPDNLGFKDYDYVVDNWKTIDDPYLVDDELTNSLAQDILDNGTFWAMIIDSYKHVFEGRHRTMMMQRAKLPSDKRFLCVVINEWLAPNEDYKIPRELYFPTIYLFNILSSEELKRRIDIGTVELLEDNPKIAKCICGNSGELVMWMQSFPGFLNKDIYAYQNEYNAQFKGSRIFNDEAYFLLAQNENFENLEGGKFEQAENDG